jgi:hypothetical protein
MPTPKWETDAGKAEFTTCRQRFAPSTTHRQLITNALPTLAVKPNHGKGFQQSRQAWAE